jgi:hypothetical protein
MTVVPLLNPMNPSSALFNPGDIYDETWDLAGPAVVPIDGAASKGDYLNYRADDLLHARAGLEALEEVGQAVEAFHAEGKHPAFVRVERIEERSSGSLIGHRFGDMPPEARRSEQGDAQILGELALETAPDIAGVAMVLAAPAMRSPAADGGSFRESRELRTSG